MYACCLRTPPPLAPIPPTRLGEKGGGAGEGEQGCGASSNRYFVSFQAGNNPTIWGIVFRGIDLSAGHHRVCPVEGTFPETPQSIIALYGTERFKGALKKVPIMPRVVSRFYSLASRAGHAPSGYFIGEK